MWFNQTLCKQKNKEKYIPFVYLHVYTLKKNPLDIVPVMRTGDLKFHIRSYEEETALVFGNLIKLI